MDITGYTTLTRQSGLQREMDLIANNIANLSTTGYRREGLVFSEFVKQMEPGTASVSMGHATGRAFDRSQGPLIQTQGTYDLAIEGDGFFQVLTPTGLALTRAGVFTPNENGELVAPDGALLLDTGGATIFIPPDSSSVSVAADGTVSADGLPISQIGVFLPEDPNDLDRREGTRFEATGPIVPAEDANIVQGFLEGSNVNAISEIARMIEVQRSYEIGQNFLNEEDERIRGLIDLVSR